MLAGLLLGLLRRNAGSAKFQILFEATAFPFTCYIRAGSFSNRSSRYVRFSESGGGVQKFEPTEST